MQVELTEGSGWIRMRVKDLASKHYKGLQLFRVDGDFRWLPGDSSGEPIATVADFFGETEIDFAEEYLLLHGNDLVSLPWED